MKEMNSSSFHRNRSTLVCLLVHVRRTSLAFILHRIIHFHACPKNLTLIKKIAFNSKRLVDCQFLLSEQELSVKPSKGSQEKIQEGGI